MDRDRDRSRYGEGSTEWMGRGESYRPAGSRRPSPPRAPPSDTYVPGGPRSRPRSRSPEGFRRRSRSPRRDGNWRDRERVRSPPPRRGFSPARNDTYRREARDRSPRRDARFEDRDRFARSPPRRNASPSRRVGEVSPNGSRGMRSPRRERVASPYARHENLRPRADSPSQLRFSPRGNGGYHNRSRSPPRRDRADPYEVDSWRKHSASPAREIRNEYAAGRDSGATSRRSSPPVHPSRAGFVPEDRPGRRDDSQGYPNRAASPSRHRDSPTDRASAFDDAPNVPTYRNGDSITNRAPPTGPAGSRGQQSANVPPSGPSVSAHNRNPILSAPSRPRGGGYGSAPGHHSTRDYNAPFYSSRRPPGPAGVQYNNPTFRPGPSSRGPPSGPGMRPELGFRGSSNSTSTTYPRSQRFGDSSRNAQHLADLPQVIPGGRKMSDGPSTARLQKLEEELERTRKMIADKEKALQPELRAWSKLERESEKAAFKSQMAEESLRALSGDEGGIAF